MENNSTRKTLEIKKNIVQDIGHGYGLVQDLWDRGTEVHRLIIKRQGYKCHSPPTHPVPIQNGVVSIRSTRFLPKRTMQPIMLYLQLEGPDREVSQDHARIKLQYSPKHEQPFATMRPNKIQTKAAINYRIYRQKKCPTASRIKEPRSFVSLPQQLVSMYCRTRPRSGRAVTQDTVVFAETRLEHSSKPGTTKYQKPGHIVQTQNRSHRPHPSTGFLSLPTSMRSVFSTPANLFISRLCFAASLSSPPSCGMHRS